MLRHSERDVAKSGLGDQLHRIMVVGQRDSSATVNMAELSSLGQLWEGEPRDNRSLQ
jgi:hypothetical protein